MQAHRDFDLWFHIGHVNLRNWLFSGLVLKRTDTVPGPVPGQQRIRLQVEPDARFDWCISLFRCVQFRVPCFLQLYHILSDDSSLLDEEMTPDWVLVQEFGAVPCLRIWKGEDEEAQDRAKARKRSRATGPGRKRPGSALQAADVKRSRTGTGSTPAGRRALGDGVPEQGEDDDAEVLVDDHIWLDEEEDSVGDGVDNLELTESEASALCDEDDEHEDADLAEAAVAEVPPPPEVPEASNEASSSSRPEAARPARRHAPEPSARETREPTSRVKQFKDLSVPFGTHGDMRYNIMSESILAVCGNPAHGPACKRTRTVRPAARSSFTNPGQGRPVGLLAAWLEESHKHSSSEAHRDAITYITLSQRRAARASFSVLAGATEITEKERPREPDEAEEPDAIR